MKNIFYTIFAGKLFPDETILPDCPEYKKIIKIISEQASALLKKSWQITFEEVEDLRDLDAGAILYEKAEGFELGFCIGVLITLEVIKTTEKLDSDFLSNILSGHLDG